MKRGPLKRTRTTRYPEAYMRFLAAVVDRRSRCAVCGQRPLDAHHVVPQQALKRFAATLRVEVEDLLADGRNGVPLCRPCHDNHENASDRLRREHVPESAWAFARDLDALLGTEAATVTIERLYP